MRCTLTAVLLSALIPLLASCDRGRSESGIDAASLAKDDAASDTVSGQSTGLGCYGDYVHNHPDLLAAYGKTSGQRIQDWGERHYLKYGQAEGRQLSAGCNSQDKTTNTNACYRSYVEVYPDLLKAYRHRPTGSGHTIASWGLQHYSRFGKTEGRTLPPLCFGGGSGNKNSHINIHQGGPRQNYSHLCQLNECRQFRNRTRRWPSTTIPVWGADKAHWRSAITRWPTVRFSLRDGQPQDGIRITGYSNKYRNYCGWAQMWHYSSGQLKKCEITLNTAHDSLKCGTESETITHEIGHCIGIFAHTLDGGIMDSSAAFASNQITASVRNILSTLYSLPPGASLSAQLPGNLARQPLPQGQYDRRGDTVIYGGVMFTPQHQEGASPPPKSRGATFRVGTNSEIFQ